MARETVYVNIAEQDVSVQLPLSVGFAGSWNQRPVAGSCHFLKAATSVCTWLRMSARPGWLAGRMSSASMEAMPYQPIARHQSSGAWPVVLFAHDWLFDSSYACRSRPVAGSFRCV